MALIPQTSIAGRSVPLGHVFGRWSSGILPGLLGGAVMGLLLCFLAMARGEHSYEPLVVISSVVLGSAATNGGAGSVATGLALHLLMATSLGMLFAFLAGPTVRARLLGLGLLYAFIIWGLSQFVVLPLVHPGLAMRIGTVWTFFLGHVAYGLLLAASVPTRKDIDDPAH